MYRARVPVENSQGPFRVIQASQVNPGNPPRGLLCADFRCEAGVCYVPPKKSHGGIHEYPAHFSTLPREREKHHQNCTLVSEFHGARDKETLAQAVEAGKWILLNLNVGPGQKRTGFGVPRYEFTPYAKWCARHGGDYHCVSISSIKKYLGVEKKLLELGGEKIFERVMVGYQTDILPHSAIDIGGTEEAPIMIFGKEGLPLPSDRQVVTEKSPEAARPPHHISNPAVASRQDSRQLALF